MKVARGWMLLLIGVASVAAADPTGTGFQPGFHQALRWSEAYGSPTTFRLRVPVARAGGKLRLSFRAGDGSAALYAVNVARAGANGALVGSAVPVMFGGSTQKTLSTRQRVTSDPISFTVSPGEELFVSFEASGALATSAILGFPGSYRWSGRNAAAATPPSGSKFYRAIGLATIDVEGPLGRAFFAIGDSITEGYVDGNTWTYANAHDDYRNAWTSVAQRGLGLPFANAGVSGQGLYDAIEHVDAEVKVLEGITDCVLLIGTNDVTDYEAPVLENFLTTLKTKLDPFCRVWMGTWVPKENTSTPATSYSEVKARRLAVNTWIRQHPSIAGYVDFEQVLANGTDADTYAPGLGADGIHPSIEGQKRMGNLAAQWLAAPAVATLSPASGPLGGGTVVTLAGQGFRPGVKVSLDGDALATAWKSSTRIEFTTPPGSAGPAAVSVRNTDGTQTHVGTQFVYSSGTLTNLDAANPAVPATVSAVEFAPVASSEEDDGLPPVEDEPDPLARGGCAVGFGGPLSLLALVVARRLRGRER